jgi:hypothetical protein
MIISCVLEGHCKRDPRKIKCVVIYNGNFIDGLLEFQGIFLTNNLFKKRSQQSLKILTNPRKLNRIKS